MHSSGPTRRTRRIAGAITATGLLLTGCGQGSTDAGDGSPSKDEGVALVAKKEFLESACPDLGLKFSGKSFSFWSSWTEQEPQAEVLKKAISCFEETTGAKVDVQWLGRASITQNVLPALSTDKVPDLVDSDIERLGAALISTGAVQSLEDVLSMKVGEGDKTVKDVLAPKALDVPQGLDEAGDHTFVPGLIFGDAWWYNKNLVKDFEKPTTIDDMFELFDKAKDSGIAAVAQDGDVSFYNAYFYTTLAEQFVGAGGLTAAASDKTGESWTKEPGLLESAKIVERLASGDYLVDGWDAGKFPQGQQGWADGNAAYNFNGTWLPVEIGEYLKKSPGSAAVEFGSFQMPAPDGATHNVVEAQPAGYVIPKKAANADVAKAFIAYSLNKDLLRGFPAMTNNITARPDLEVPDNLKDVQAAIDSAEELTIFEDGLGSLAGGTYASEVFWPNSDALLKGKLSAEEFVEEMAAETKTFWAKQ